MRSGVHIGKGERLVIERGKGFTQKEEDPIYKCVAVMVKNLRNPAGPHFTTL